MTHVSVTFNGDVKLALVPGDADDKAILKQAFTNRELKPTFSIAEDGTFTLTLEKKKEVG